MHIKKNDLVIVIGGNEKGKRGKVLEIALEKNRAVVEGVHLVKKHQRARSAAKPGGIVTIPGYIHISNLALICPKCGKRVKVRREKIEKHRTRICKDCGEIIDAK
jgi:large subunit ribosomal protein L24